MNSPFFTFDLIDGEYHFYPSSFYNIALYIKSNKELTKRFVKFLISERDEF